MKIRDVKANNRRHEFELETRAGTVYSFPYSHAHPVPSSKDRISEVFVDKELGNEAITFVLESGKEGSVHIEQVLEYHKDPKYFAELISYKLTVEAINSLDSSGLSRRQIAKRMKTSVPQLYRLLDPTNTRKSMNQLITLLHVLNREVEVVVSDKSQHNKSFKNATTGQDAHSVGAA